MAQKAKPSLTHAAEEHAQREEEACWQCGGSGWLPGYNEECEACNGTGLLYKQEEEPDG